jgi:hypothetical protein
VVDIKAVIASFIVKARLIAAELFSCSFRLGCELFQGSPDSQDLVADRLQGGHSRADRHQAVEPAPQLITPHVLGLAPQRKNRVVRSECAVDEFLVEGPDGDGVEERRGSGSGAAGLLYFGRIEEARAAAGRSIACQADGVGGLFARRADEADGLAYISISRRVDINVHLTRRVERILQQCIFIKATVHQDLLDSPLKLGRVEPALDLAFDIDPVALLLKDLVGQRSVGVDAVVDRHLQAAQHNGDEAARAGAADHFEVLAWLRWRLPVDGRHELLKNHQRRQATDAAAIEGEEPDLVARHCELYSQKF